MDEELEIVRGDGTIVHEVARATPFGGRIAHGPLIFSLATGLFTQADPLNSIAFLGMTWKYLKPVAIGDTVRVQSTLTDTRVTSAGDRAIVHHKREVLNQRDEVVLEARVNRRVKRSPRRVWLR